MIKYGRKKAEKMLTGPDNATTGFFICAPLIIANPPPIFKV